MKMHCDPEGEHKSEPQLLLRMRAYVGMCEFKKATLRVGGAEGRGVQEMSPWFVAGVHDIHNNKKLEGEDNKEQAIIRR